MYTATQEQIEAWRDKYGQGNVTRLKSKRYDKSAYFRKPDRKEMEFLSAGAHSSGIKFNASILKTCFLAGDEEIMSNDDIFLGLQEQILELLKFDEVEVEKL